MINTWKFIFMYYIIDQIDNYKFGEDK
jgi:hypothetical protein